MHRWTFKIMNLYLSSIDKPRSMDLSNILFNAHIVGPTNSGHTQYLVNQLWSPFHGRFDYIVLICTTMYLCTEQDLLLVCWEGPMLFLLHLQQNKEEVGSHLKKICFKAPTLSSSSMTLLPQKMSTSALASWSVSASALCTATSVCEWWLSRSPASQSLSGRTWRWSTPSQPIPWRQSLRIMQVNCQRREKKRSFQTPRG